MDHDVEQEHPDMTKSAGTLALHVGGSKFSAGVVSSDGTVQLRDRVPAPSRDPWTVIAGLVKRICAAADEFELDGCGVSIGGPVNVRSGTVAPLNIPIWKDFPLSQSVAELTGLRTVIDNEAKALASGEAWAGAAVGESDFLAVYIGSSVSAGLVSGGRVLDGNFGNAGFIGHMLVDPGGKACRCGGQGCLEAYVSARAIESETGHAPAYASHALIERNALLVGRVIASTLAILDVPKVLIGGSVVGTWGKPFLDTITTEIRSRARLDFTRDVEVLAASLGSYGVLVGAAALVHGRPAGGS
jgi:glucokinase